MSKLSRYESKTVLHTDLDTAWAFFSDPRNLARITPPHMGFVIHTPLPPKAYAGLVIEYTVRPLLGIPLRWVTEITHLDEGRMFVDEQRFGPYAFWHHQHLFEKTVDGVTMTDIVHYRAPMGVLGKLADVILIRNQIDGIFAFRSKVIAQTFNKI
jgi:ligand-binding SRPBCC domain-containing protein